MFQTGTNEWREYQKWPLSCAGCADKGRALYVQAGGGLSFDPPSEKMPPGKDAYDEDVADPAKPVLYRPRPDRPPYARDSTWDDWLVDDQRFADGKPDVLSYSTKTLTPPVTLAGAPVTHLFASTTRSDADWVVKLIDVYPPTDPEHPEPGRTELGVGMDILRGRYGDDLSHPSQIPAGQVVPYTLKLLQVSHVLLPGHRIMVQIKSSWFPP